MRSFDYCSCGTGAEAVIHDSRKPPLEAATTEWRLASFYDPEHWAWLLHAFCRGPRDHINISMV